MEFLTPNDKRVAELPSDDQDNDLVVLHIVEHAEIAYAEFELGERIRAESLDRPSPDYS
jgi:hypothetical protein